MPTQTVTFSESTSSSRSQIVTLPNLKAVANVTVNTGNATYSISGNDVTINVSGGAYTRYTTSSYTPSETASTTLTSSTNSFPATTIATSPSGYSGSIPKSGSSYVQSGSAGSSDAKYATTTHSITITSTWKWQLYSGTYQWVWQGDSCSPNSYTYTDAQGYSGTVSFISTNDAPAPYPTGTGTSGQIKTTSKTGTGNYSGTLTKTIPDTRVYAQYYSGTVYGSTQTSYTYYYAYTATVNYIEYQPPTAPSIIFPSSGTIISTTPNNITWNAGSDLETATSSLTYEIGISLDGGSNYSNIVSLTSVGVTSYAYDFLQNADSTQVKLRMRTYDGSMYSGYTYSSLFTITHNLPPSIVLNINGNSVTDKQVYLISDSSDLNFSFVPNDVVGDSLQYSVLLRGVEKIPYTPVSIGETVNFTVLNSDLLLGNNTVLIKVKDDKNAELIFTVTLRNKTSQTISQYDVLEILQSLGYTNTNFSSLNDLKPIGYTGKLSLSDIINFLN